MLAILLRLSTIALILSLSISGTFAAENDKPQGPPPLLVEVAEVTSGTANPLIELIGSIEYGRISRVSSEVSGLVEKVHFKEGQRVKAGQSLLNLRSDLLKKSLTATDADVARIRLEQEKAAKDLKRISALYAKKSISETLYDDSYYRSLTLGKQAAALQANSERQRLEIKKTTIRAPFDGLVQSKSAERGEWVPTGGQVAIIVDDRNLEAHIEVPQHLISYLKSGSEIPVVCAGKEYQAHFVHLVPRGDIATRTFTVKLKLPPTQGLFAGMEAKAMLPSGPGFSGLLVPRDAVISKFGKEVVFVAAEGKAQMLPVEVKGYHGLQVAVEAPGLEIGQQVVIKGNERLMPGQALRF